MLFTVALAVLAFTSIVSSSSLLADQASHVSPWIKLSPHLVCFHGRKNGYGSFHNYVKAGEVVELKLEWVSGQIRCVSAVEYNSKWGCGDYPGLLKFPLDVVVTDRYDQLLFPHNKRFHRKHGGLWYWMPFVNTKTSKEIIFTDYATPFYFPLHEQMRIWYGEDLKNYYEGDDQGHVCVNVYAKFLI